MSLDLFQTGKNLEAVFAMFDSNGRSFCQMFHNNVDESSAASLGDGWISQSELYDALNALNLGLTREGSAYNLTFAAL